MKKLDEIKNEFLAQYVMASEKTKVRCTHELELFFKVCEINTFEDLKNFNNQQMVKFYEYAKEKEWGPSTTNLRLQTAKMFTKWCEHKCILDRDVLEDIKRMRTTTEVHYTPLTKDCESLLTYIKQHTEKRRLYLMTKLIVMCGFRRSEICNLKIDDISYSDSTIRVFGKGRKILNQPVPQSLLQEIKDYIENERADVMATYKKMGGNDKGFIFVSGIGEKCDKSAKDLTNGNQVNDNVFYQQIKRYSKKVGLDKVTPHALRRSAGTEIYNLTGDIKTASEFLRHASVSTTEKCYIDYNRQKLTNAIDLYARNI